MASLSPSPPVAFKNHCAILHSGVLYVYQPDAFQILELKDGAKWKQETNGIAVTGAVCVKGGVDGDSNKPALYVVGGTTNASTTNYTGLQRYSILDKVWTTITPQSSVTAQRQYHGATYLNASSALLVYGGSQNGNTGPSTETFLMLMYPPYRIQSYPSTAPAGVNPVVLAMNDTDAIMVGGSTTNQKIFRFHPDPGWVDFGLALPAPLPDKSVAQSSIVTLNDNSKLLITYDTSQVPNTVRRNVLLNAGGLPAVYNQRVGDPTSSSVAPSTTSARPVKRATYLSTYPAYNSSSAPNITRTNFALAFGDSEIVAFVGGDANNTVNFFNSFENSWKPASAFLGSEQQPLTVSSSTTTSPTPTAAPSTSQIVTATHSSTPAAVPESNSSNGLTILGGVLGGVCGLAAILIILLLYLRQVRRKSRAQQQQQNKAYPQEDKPSFEEQGLQPLSRQAQPMGRSPVTSVAMDGRDSVAIFGPRSEKVIEPVSPAPVPVPKGQLGLHANGSGIGFGFKREKSPLTISKPMMPDLGDYQVRPSIELGKATPTVPTATVDTGIVTALPDAGDTTKKDQRKTDEGWAKYFSAEKEASKRDTTMTNTTQTLSTTSPKKGGRGGFWPGSGVPETTTRTKTPLRDSEGRNLTAHKVVANSPNLTSGATDIKTRTMSTAEGLEAKISSADSVSTGASDDEDDDDEYEDEGMTAYSSGVPESIHENTWTPVGNTWSGPPQRLLRPPSVQIGAHDFPPPPTTSDVAASVNTESSKSSLPNFPMPATTVRRAQPSAAQPAGLSFAPAARASGGSSVYGPRIASEDYFGRPIQLVANPKPSYEPSQHQREPSQPAVAPTDPSDMSWINLGTPAAGTSSHHTSPDPQQPNPNQ